MSNTSKRCSNLISKDKYCHAVTFFDETKGEQCPRECAHCGGILNKDFKEEHERLRKDGPTLMEWIDAGHKVETYPPEGFESKPWTKADELRVQELSDIENKYNELLEEQKDA